METLAHKQTTTHPSSHGEDEACVGAVSYTHLTLPTNREV